MSRSKGIRIRLTEEEHKRLRTLAGKTSISAFLRLQALGPDRQRQLSDRLPLIAELARIRNMLTQIARLSEARPLSEQVHLVTRLVAVEQQLLKIGKP